MEYKSDIIFLLEPRINGKNVNLIIEKLGFNFSHRVEATHFPGIIWIGWKDPNFIFIIFNHPQFILIRVSDKAFLTPFYIYFIYESLDRKRRKELWNALKTT